ncbi:hypothetical protein TRIP_D300077 [uncultured Paludibacter sp.]|nr:hypothetical protein TRIP_D300077 [uncultured Paludibacter sp.]
MKICFYFPFLSNPQNNAIFGGMYRSFFEELENLRIEVTFTTLLEEIKGDILVTNIGGGWEKQAAKAMTIFNGPVILYVYNAYLNFNRLFLKRWHSRILFAYNPDYAKLNFEKYKSVNIPYFDFPFGSDEKIFYPFACKKKYDISFLGNANSGSGRDKYIKELIDYVCKNNLNVFLAGAGWDKYGFPYRIITHGKDTNTLYNESKVCINIHNDRQYLGIDKEMDANNRLFDLAMAGCCQVSNGEQMISRYFEKDEIATADNADEWIKKIDFYLKNEKERDKRGENARNRALKEHTWNARAKYFIQLINQQLPDYSSRSQKVSLFNSLFRCIDRKLPPLYLMKEIRIIRFTLIKLKLYNKK